MKVFIQHDGEKRPVDLDTKVTVLFRDDFQMTDKAGNFVWNWTQEKADFDIIGWKLAE